MVQVRGAVVANVADTVVVGEGLGSPDVTGDRSGAAVGADEETAGQVGHNEDQGILALEDASTEYHDSKFGARVLLR
jgi:hypothetical protein